VSVTITITLPIDHPRLPAILELAGEREGVPPAAPPENQLDVLERLLKHGLNDGESKFLLELARASPAVVPYPRLVELCGSPQKLGNVTAGLFRRWRARGGIDENAPWIDAPDAGGRRMEPEIATVILDRL